MGATHPGQNKRATDAARKQKGSKAMDSRRPERVYLRVPILVRGSDDTRGPFSEVTATVNISRTGARIALQSLPACGSDIQITNLSTNRVANFKVAYRGRTQVDGRTDFGVISSDPSADLWAIKFEDSPQTDESPIAGLLVCSRCEQRIFGQLSWSEYNGLSENFNFRRFCGHCQSVTEWTVGSSDETPPDYGTGRPSHADLKERIESDSHPLHQVERRGAIRYALKVPLLVTGRTNNPERTVTEDLSSMGLMFTCRQRFEVGEVVQVIVGHGLAESPGLKTCKIVRRVPTEDSTRYNYGAVFQTTT